MAAFDVPPNEFAGGPVGARISTRLVDFYTKRVGRGPTKVRTYISDDVVLSVMRDAATKAERELHRAGQNEVVREARGIIRRQHSRELGSIVEEATDRRVLCTLGDFDPEHGIVALVFPLARGDRASGQSSGRS